MDDDALCFIFTFCRPKAVISMRLSCKQFNESFKKKQTQISSHFKKMCENLCEDIINYDDYPSTSLNWLRFYWELECVLCAGAYTYVNSNNELCIDKMIIPLSIVKSQAYHQLLIFDICENDLLLLFEIVFKEKYNNNPNIQLNCPVSKQSGTPLTYKRFRDNSKILRYLLDKAHTWKKDFDVRILINATGNTGNYNLRDALITAVMENNINNAEMILESELMKSINEDDPCYKFNAVNYYWNGKVDGKCKWYCPLAVACILDNVEMIELLINNEANLDSMIGICGDDFSDATTRLIRQMQTQQNENENGNGTENENDSVDIYGDDSKNVECDEIINMAKLDDSKCTCDFEKNVTKSDKKNVNKEMDNNNSNNNKKNVQNDASRSRAWSINFGCCKFN